MRPHARFAPLLLALSLLALYLPGLGFPFLNIDDDYVIAKNPWLFGGETPPGAPELSAFARSAPLLAAFTETDRFWMGSEWLPLASLSLKLDAWLWGRRAWGFRVTNLILLLACALLLHRCLRLLLDVPARAWSAPALLATLWFCLHPLRVENTAWLAMRKDLLAGVFVAACWLRMLRFQRKPRMRALAWAVLLFAAALLSKATSIFVPVALALQLWLLPTSLSLRQRVAALAPFFLLALVDFSIVYGIARSEGIVRAAAPPMEQVLRTDFSIAFHYLCNTVLPLQLNALYHWPDVGWSDPAVLAGVAILALWLLLLFRERQRQPLLSLGIGWALLGLIPVLNLFPKSTRAADRYTWFFCLGLAVVAAWGLRALQTTRWWRAGWRSCVVVLVALAMGSELRLWDFSSSERLCRSIVAGPHPAPHAWVHLGWALYEQKRWQEALEAFERAMLELALPDFDQAPRIEARLGAGVTHMRLGQLEAALIDFAQVLEVSPRHPIALHNQQLVSRLLLERRGEE